MSQITKPKTKKLGCIYIYYIYYIYIKFCLGFRYSALGQQSRGLFSPLCSFNPVLLSQDAMLLYYTNICLLSLPQFVFYRFGEFVQRLELTHSICARLQTVADSFLWCAWFVECKTNLSNIDKKIKEILTELAQHSLLVLMVDQPQRIIRHKPKMPAKIKLHIRYQKKYLYGYRL